MDTPCVKDYYQFIYILITLLFILKAFQMYVLSGLTYAHITQTIHRLLIRRSGIIFLNKLPREVKNHSSTAFKNGFQN